MLVLELIIDEVKLVVKILEDVKLVTPAWFTWLNNTSVPVWYKSPSESTITILTGIVEG